MKLTGRDKKLLLFLAIVAACAVYYFFLMVPKEEQLKNYEEEIAVKNNEMQAINMKLSSEKSLDERIEELEYNILTKSEGYYSFLNQEDFLMTMLDFKEDLTLHISNIAVSESSYNDGDGTRLSADVNFDSDFQSFLSFLRSVENHSKKVSVRDVSIQRKNDEEISGRYTLDLYALPMVAGYSTQLPNLVTARSNFRDIIGGPFVPYEGFEQVVEVDYQQPDFSFPTFPTYPDDEIIIDFEKYRPRTQIYGFEDGSNFFVANLPEIEGTLTRSMTRVAGGYSAHLRFDFGNPRPYSEANIVFDHEPVMINRQAEFLGVWVYAYEASNHNIGAVIIDAAGREYKVELANGVNWTQWKEIEVKLPVEISYPCVIQRIYVEGIGYDQKLTGNYLFDQLQVSYPVQ